MDGNTALCVCINKYTPDIHIYAYTRGFVSRAEGVVLHTRMPGNNSIRRLRFNLNNYRKLMLKRRTASDTYVSLIHTWRKCKHALAVCALRVFAFKAAFL